MSLHVHRVKPLDCVVSEFQGVGVGGGGGVWADCHASGRESVSKGSMGKTDGSMSSIWYQLAIRLD